MKNFDLEAAKRGAAVCTRNGKNVRIVCSDRRGESHCVVIALLDSDEYERVEYYSVDGELLPRSVSKDDLMMRDDNYLEKLERGGYDHIADASKMTELTIKQNLNTDREYWRRVYAGQAMQGIVSALDMNTPIAEDGVADKACTFADALIEELEKTEKK